jgi:aminopeptidase N
MLRRLPAALLLLTACGATTDLTVPPPPKGTSGFQVEVPPPLDTGRLPDWATPRHYHLRLHIDPAANRFAGDAVIDVALAKSASAIVLHAAGLDVSRAEVVSGDRRVRADVSRRKAAGAVNEEEEIVVVPASTIPAGDVELHFEYQGPLEETLRGIYRVREGDKTYVFTQFEPSDARRLFPCFDDPIYKTPFDVAVTVPKGNEVFGNTPEQKREPAAGEAITVTFETTKPMPTYLVALAIGPLEIHEGQKEPVPLRVITTPGKGHLGDLALATAAEHLVVLADLFGKPYPYAKLDLVAVPNFGPGAMENAGIITFREALILVDGKTASAQARRDLAMVLAHELAHQWFGNLVTMEWWDDLWLNEGFATYMESLVVDRWKPQMRAGLEIASLAGWVMELDALHSARAVRQPVHNTYEAEEAFDGITYIKGASVIRMLHRWLGDDKFVAGLRGYIAEHAWGNAAASDMFRELGKASGQDVGAVASTFLDQAGVPLVRAELVCTADQPPIVELAQERYRATPGAAAEAPATWKIPVCVEYGGAAGKPERACTLLADKTTRLALAPGRCPTWLLPNAGYEGYYRFALPAAGFDALAQATQKRDTIAKVGFLSNAWALVQAGELDASVVLDLLLAWKRERDREVVEQMVNVLEHVGDAVVDNAARPRFQELCTAVLLPIAQRLGWDGRAGEDENDKLMRHGVLGALAILTDDPWMVREGQKRAEAYLVDPASVDADTASIALRVAARHDGIGFDRLVAALGTAKTPAQRVAIVQALGSLGDEKALQRALALVGTDKVRAQDTIHIMRSAIEWPDSRAVFIDWLHDHMAELAEKMPGFGVSRLLGPIHRLCDATSQKAAATAFTPVVTRFGGERRLQEALDSAALCIDLRARQADKVADYLAKKKRL